MTQILMPALSPTMEEGNLAKWLVKVGDKIEPGQVIAEIETDKATMEVEAVDEGTVTALLIEEGAQGVKVNTPIAELQGEGEAVQQKLSPPSRGRGQGEGGRSDAPTPASTRTTDRPPPPTPAPQGGGGPTAQTDPEIPAGTQMIKITLRDALRDAMAEEMRRDDKVFVMGEEVAEYQGAYKVTRELLQEFGPTRVVDTPITEHGFAGLGVGAAMAGLKPIVEFMTWNFAMQAIDHIINSAAKTLYMSGGQIKSSIVFRGPNGAASRVAAQHSQDYSSWYSHIPGLIVIAPYDAADAKGLLKAAIRNPNPVVFLEHEMLYGTEFEIPDVADWIVPIGKAKVRRQGVDVTITAHARMVGHALKAADELSKQGIEAEVIDLRTLRPLDSATIIESVKKTNRLVTVEEGWGQSGVGAEICARVMSEAFDYLDAPPTRIHQVDAPLAYAANLEALALPNVDDIVDAVKAVTYR
ncbi:pyruvate dehydrogenase complex E1 component subunit beta [Terricaulis silvestris]|uniref:Pyruvate dehydrogenase E1 component subunit beta n=1 Tax=Terricaulis silvestris TaxID=2686094 RepID=A0A6I6MQW8_9CAUL|nr:pyruvate dehydrogenase complex E1 component subunit beta [Terricaulis silvestris]QGZ95167.1 2-oxoisovalerate dehydrogenase subunit beta [Terricaulis silvestris]